MTPPALALALSLLTGCASATTDLYVDWIPLANPAVACDGAADCVQRGTYRGKPLCTIITADREVSYARLGAQVRACLQ